MSDDEMARIWELLGREETLVRHAFEAAGRKRIEAATVATFHCRAKRSCTVLTVWRTPQGLMFYRPRHRTSPAVTAAESSASGRAKNTEDGDGRWRAKTYFLDQAANVTLDCDHLRQRILDVDTVDADAHARRGLVIVLDE